MQIKPYCQSCFLIGFCQQRCVPIVNDAEISSPALVRAVRNFCETLNVPAGQMLDYLADSYRDLDAEITDAQGEVIFLDFSPLETDPDDADILVHCPRGERLRDWFRTMTTIVPDNVTPYIRGEAKERFRILATIIIAANPDINWPRILPANDNIRAANDNCSLKELSPA